MKLLFESILGKIIVLHFPTDTKFVRAFYQKKEDYNSSGLKASILLVLKYDV